MLALNQCCAENPLKSFFNSIDPQWPVLKWPKLSIRYLFTIGAQSFIISNGLSGAGGWELGSTPAYFSWRCTCYSSNIRLQTRPYTIALGAQNAPRKCILRTSSWVNRDSTFGPSHVQAASTRKACPSKTC